MADDVPRIDVFSFKGGVGKTTVSWQLARHIAEKENGPVLLLDADFTGTSLGEFLFPSHPWHQELNLAHLLVMEPERLPDVLRDELPVRGFSSKAEQSDRLKSPAEVLICQSHALSEGIDHAVLHALLAQESVGGWVHHVLDLLARSVHKRSALKALIVDHSPGIGSLQEKTILEVNSCKVFVTSMDLPDVQMVYRYLLSAKKHDEQACFIFNKIPIPVGTKPMPGLPQIAEWTDLISGTLPSSEDLFKRSVSLPESTDIQQALRTRGAASLKHFTEQLGQIWSWVQESRQPVTR